MKNREELLDKLNEKLSAEYLVLKEKYKTADEVYDNLYKISNCMIIKDNLCDLLKNSTENRITALMNVESLLENIYEDFLHFDDDVNYINEYFYQDNGLYRLIDRLARKELENKTLYDYIQLSGDEEITVFDDTYDIETYFYKRDLESNDEWDIALEELSRLLPIKNILPSGVEVSFTTLIEYRLPALRDANLFFDNTDIDDVMEDLEAILAGNVSEKWMKKFVDTLKNGYDELNLESTQLDNKLNKAGERVENQKEQFKNKNRNIER